ncbi:GyrI-like domain-containing protein [Thalassotalea euphylliae]|uniref:GyrI-like domain-containing protein n=1 Tax=Thalassotalea euphylliae TaxID=1655234 RepID=UPI0036291BA1
MKVKHFDGQVVHGLSARTNNANEFNPETGKIPALWQQFDLHVPVNYQAGERVYGVYDDYASDFQGDFTVLAGFDGRELPKGITLEKRNIPAGKYLAFSKSGDMPQIAIDAWTDVWQYFTSDSCAHERLYKTDFEYYPNGNTIEVYIGIK